MDWLRPSPRLWTARLVEVGVLGGLLTAAGTLAVGLSAGPRLDWVATLIVLLLCAGLWGVLLHRRYLAWGYAERADDLVVRRGVLVRRVSVVPYGRMQFIDVTAGPVERSLGLATVRLHTAAAATDARIPGLPADQAAALRDRLAALGEARAAGL